MVALLGWERRGVIGPIEPRPSVADVDGIAIAIQLPQTWYRHSAPIAIVELYRLEAYGVRCEYIFEPEELPLAIYRAIER